MCTLKLIMVMEVIIMGLSCVILVMDLEEKGNIECSQDGWKIKVPDDMIKANLMEKFFLLMAVLPIAQFIDIMHTIPKNCKYFEAVDIEKLQQIQGFNKSGWNSSSAGSRLHSSMKKINHSKIYSIRNAKVCVVE